MQEHRLILTLGTNIGSPSPLELALKELRKSVILLKISSMMQTEPIDFPHSSPPFLNLVAIASTSLSYGAVLHDCKRIEILCGRTSIQRQTSPDIIPLDLDIVLWDNEICKPRDLDRPYFIEGLSYLLSPL